MIVHDKTWPNSTNGSIWRKMNYYNVTTANWRICICRDAAASSTAKDTRLGRCNCKQLQRFMPEPWPLHLKVWIDTLFRHKSLSSTAFHNPPDKMEIMEQLEDRHQEKAQQHQNTRLINWWKKKKKKKLKNQTLFTMVTCTILKSHWNKNELKYLLCVMLSVPFSFSILKIVSSK